jgi:hypothetical protein
VTITKTWQIKRIINASLSRTVTSGIELLRRIEPAHRWYQAGLARAKLERAREIVELERERESKKSGRGGVALIGSGGTDGREAFIPHH